MFEHFSRVVIWCVYVLLDRDLIQFGIACLASVIDVEHFSRVVIWCVSSTIVIQPFNSFSSSGCCWQPRDRTPLTVITEVSDIAAALQVELVSSPAIEMETPASPTENQEMQEAGKTIYVSDADPGLYPTSLTHEMAATQEWVQDSASALGYLPPYRCRSAKLNPSRDTFLLRCRPRCCLCSSNKSNCSSTLSFHELGLCLHRPRYIIQGRPKYLYLLPFDKNDAVSLWP